MNKTAGLESLALKEIQRPRSFSVEGGSDADLFDSESECFSALHPGSDSSASSRSAGGNSASSAGATTPMKEKDIDSIDANLISLTTQNKDFQRLVEEAKAEKNKSDGPSPIIDTEYRSDDESPVIREESKDLSLD